MPRICPSDLFFLLPYKQSGKYVEQDAVQPVARLFDRAAEKERRGDVDRQRFAEICRDRQPSGAEHGRTSREGERGGAGRDRVDGERVGAWLRLEAVSGAVLG